MNLRVLIGLLLAAMSIQAADYKILARYPVPGNGGFDYVTLDPSTRHLYMSHSTQVNVIDADSGKVLGAITDTPGVHGIAIATEFKHGFTSNGGENKVTMFDSVLSRSSAKSKSAKNPMASTTTPPPNASLPTITAPTI